MAKSALPAIAGAMYRFDFWGETLEHFRIQLRELDEPTTTEGEQLAEAAREKKRKLIEGSIAIADKQPRIVYILEVPTVKQRIEFEAEVGYAAHAPSDLELYELMREEALRIYGDPSPEYELAGDLAEAGAKASEADQKRGTALIGRMRSRSPDLNSAMVARERAVRMSAFLAVKFFCHQVEGAPYTLERDAQGVTDESLTLIQADLELIGGKIRSLMTLSGAARKNLQSRSLNASSQESSTAAAGQPMAAPAGNC